MHRSLIGILEMLETLCIFGISSQRRKYIKIIYFQHNLSIKVSPLCYFPEWILNTFKVFPSFYLLQILKKCSRRIRRSHFGSYLHYPVAPEVFNPLQLKSLFLLRPVNSSLIKLCRPALRHLVIACLPLPTATLQWKLSFKRLLHFFKP